MRPPGCLGPGGELLFVSHPLGGIDWICGPKWARIPTRRREVTKMESYDPPGAGPGAAFPPDVTAALGSSDATFTIGCDGSGLTKDRLAEWEQLDPEAARVYMRAMRADIAAIPRKAMEGTRAALVAAVRKSMEDTIRLFADVVAQHKAARAVRRRVPRPTQRTLTRRREIRSRAHARRGPPADDEGPEPPASAFQRAHRALLPLTAGELGAVASVAVIRADWLRGEGRWAA